PNQAPGRLPHCQQAPELLREQLRLVEAALALTARMERNRYEVRGRLPLDDHALRQEVGKRPGQLAPAAVLEPVDRRFDRAFVRRGRAQPVQRAKASLARARRPRRFDLRAAPPAEGLL